MGYTKDQLLVAAAYWELNIDFSCYDHPVVLAVEEQAKYVGHLGGSLSKNLLLKDKKHRLYVVSALAGTKVDMKILSQRLGLGKGGLRMSPEENLLEVPLGCVTPFALINESASAVSLLLDQGFKSKQSCYFHPPINDVTIALSSSNLDKFLMSIGRQPAYVDLEASPVVGKDNLPDLADLVPLGVQNSSGPIENVTPTNIPLKMMFSKRRHAFLVSKKLNVMQEELSLILDSFKKRATSDLESVTMILKNASYMAGFEAGFETMLNSGLNGWPSWK